MRTFKLEQGRDKGKTVITLEGELAGEYVPVVEAYMKNLLAGTDQVQATVEDSGIGIDPEKLDKIFDSFYTSKPSGMGLSISRSILLQAHGGRLWATAKDGPGTMFHFTLSKYQEEESNAAVAGV